MGIFQFTEIILSSYRAKKLTFFVPKEKGEIF